MMDDPQIPHTLTAEVWRGDILWAIKCPYGPRDRERPCLIVEPASCKKEDNCDGFDHDEYGHVHRGVGCALIEYFDADGWDAVPWKPDSPGPLHLPAKITLTWEPGDYSSISLVREPTFGDRVEDGGSMGTIVRCSECGGSGQLHEPDELPPLVQPQEGPA